MLKELATYLAANVTGSPALVVGDNLFAGWRPEDAPDRCVLIQERVQGQQYRDGTELREKTVQVTARSLDMFEARSDAHRIYDLLINRAGIDLGGGWSLQSVTGGEPFYIGMDARDRHDYTCNLTLVAKK